MLYVRFAFISIYIARKFNKIAHKKISTNLLVELDYLIIW